ncbi:MAG: hypothetical protein WCK17_12720, partial [Verrucomicrobiota bacterium]
LFAHARTADDDNAGWVTVMYNKLALRADAATDILPDIKNKPDADLVLVFRHIWPHFPKFRAACAADREFMLRMMLCNVASLPAFEKTASAFRDGWDIAQHAKGLVDALEPDLSAAAKARVPEAKVADGICRIFTLGGLSDAIRTEINTRTTWPSDAVLRVIHHFEWQDDRTSTTGFLASAVTAANSADTAFFLGNMRLGEDDDVIKAAIDVSKNGFTDVGGALLRTATAETLQTELAKLAPAEHVHLVVCAELPLAHTPYLGPVEALARKWYRNEAGRSTHQALQLLKKCALSESEVGPYITLAMKRGGALARQAKDLPGMLPSSSFGRLGSFLYTE